MSDFLNVEDVTMAAEGHDDPIFNQAPRLSRARLDGEAATHNSVSTSTTEVLFGWNSLLLDTIAIADSTPPPLPAHSLDSSGPLHSKPHFTTYDTNDLRPAHAVALTRQYICLEGEYCFRRQPTGAFWSANSSQRDRYTEAEDGSSMVRVRNEGLRKVDERFLLGLIPHLCELDFACRMVVLCTKANAPKLVQVLKKGCMEARNWSPGTTLKETDPKGKEEHIPVKIADAYAQILNRFTDVWPTIEVAPQKKKDPWSGRRASAPEYPK